MLTKTEVEKLLNQKISKQNKEIFKQMAQAISDNNIKLFNVLARQEVIKENYVSKEELQAKIDKVLNLLDKMYGLMKKRDQEQLVMSHQVNNHESRLTNLETALV